MKQYPAVPHVDDAPSGLFDGGHLWIQELLDGGHFRVRMRASGVLEFGDSDRVFDGDEMPLAYRHAVRHVREELDREALRAAVDDVESVVLFAEAMHRTSVDYEWHRTPSVLGFDVWDADRAGFLPPDAVDRVFERLGLRPVNTFEKEVRAADFEPDPGVIPASAWRDSPAAGLVLRNKTGDRAVLPNPAVETDVDPEPLAGSAEELAERYATHERLRRLATEVDARDGGVGFDPLFDRTFESILREAHARFEHRRTEVEVSEFRSALAARVRQWLADR